jgi:hypothetical protein
LYFQKRICGRVIRIPAEFRRSVAIFRRLHHQMPDFPWGLGVGANPGMGLANDPGMASPRPFIPAKSYYLELNGKPSCTSNAHPQGHPAWVCAYESHQAAQEGAQLVWRDHPSCIIAIKEGPCPRDVEVWEDQQERMWEYE